MGEMIRILLESIVNLVLLGVAIFGAAWLIVRLFEEVKDYYENKKGDKDA